MALTKPWEIVISDWSMPNFTGLDAFHLVREADVDLPFIPGLFRVGHD